MKGSRISLLVGILFAIVPALSIKLNLWLKYKYHHWTFLSSRTRQDLSTVKLIILKDVKTFRYNYRPDSSFLEYNAIYDSDYIKLKEDTLLSIFKRPNPENEKGAVIYNTSQLFSIFSNPDQFIMLQQNKYRMGTTNIILYGPVCPPIKAINTTFFIDSVRENTSFDFDLDFSTFYWENYKKKVESNTNNRVLFDKKATTPWYLNRLNLKLNQSSFFLSNNIHFNELDIKAIKKTDLDIDSDLYKEANIVVDSTVIVRAPVSIWKKLKLTLAN